MPRPLLLIHGYSSNADAMKVWAGHLRQGSPDVRVIEYRSLTNEITVPDLAEGLDRALRAAGVADDEPFDAVVHSTGMLVIRAWLDGYAPRKGRLKHLVALAPATFGSPLAHKGRSFLGGVLKGSRNPFGPDFLEAGDRVLDALELASPFTWNLIQREFYGPDPTFTSGPDTPYVFVFCGTKTYGGLADVFANTPGGDGTVRWAGCPLDTQQFVIDLRGDTPATDRLARPVRHGTHCPFFPIPSVHHGTILSRPPRYLVDLVRRGLAVDDAAGWRAWCRAAHAATDDARARLTRWQQLVVRVTDERGDGVADWYMELRGRRRGGRSAKIETFAADVHKYDADHSYRCFHVDLDTLRPETLDRLELRLVARSGTELVAYTGSGATRDDTVDPAGRYAAKLNVTKLLAGRVTLFHPFTTTLLHLKLDREPQPLDPTKPNRLVYFGA